MPIEKVQPDTTHAAASNGLVALSVPERTLLNKLKRHLTSAEPVALPAYFQIRTFQSLKEKLASQDFTGLVTPDEAARIIAIIAAEIPHREKPAVRAATGTLAGLPAATSDEPVALSHIFSAAAPSSLQDIEAFLAQAQSGPAVGGSKPLSPAAAAEILAYEKLAIDLQGYRLGGLEIDAALKAIQHSYPDAVAAMYLDMSYAAAEEFLREQMKRTQGGDIGHHDVDEKMIMQPTLRLLGGKDAMTHDEGARHTLRYDLTRRIDQIRRLPGAERLGDKEIARRIAFSYREKGFLADVNLPIGTGFRN